MSGNVIHLNERKIWVCGCGCSSYELVTTGHPECAHCHDPICADCGGWYMPPSDAPDRSESLDAPFSDVQGNGSVEFAKRRTSTVSTDDDTAMILVVKSNGDIHIWSDGAQDDHMSWCRRAFDNAMDLLRKTAKHDE